MGNKELIEKFYFLSKKFEGIIQSCENLFRINYMNQENELNVIKDINFNVYHDSSEDSEDSENFENSELRRHTFEYINNSNNNIETIKEIKDRWNSNRNRMENELNPYIRKIKEAYKKIQKTKYN